MPREGNDPRRRIVEPDRLSSDERRALADKAVYEGIGYHKKFPAAYGLGSATGRRPTKSICDGIRIILGDEAERLLRDGISEGMFSEPMGDGFPTYIWSVDGDGEAYEAKTHPNNRSRYHGYRLEEDDAMREYVLKTWKQRCR
jgi:hypothetical protein